MALQDRGGAPIAGGSSVATTAYVDAGDALKAPLDSPHFTTAAWAPTPVSTDNGTYVATTAFVQAQKVSPAFTGTPTAPTPSTFDNSTKIATTAFVYAATANQYNGATNSGTRQYQRIATLNGVNTSSGADITVLVSGFGDFGQAKRGTAIVQLTQRGTNPSGLTGRVNWLTGWDNTTFYYISTGSYTAELWVVGGNYQFTPTVTILDAQSATVTMDSATTAAPANLVALPVNADLEFISNDYASTTSPAFTGVPTAPNPAKGDASTRISTTSWVAAYFAQLSGANFTGQVSCNNFYSPSGGTMTVGTLSMSTTGLVNTAALGLTGNQADFTLDNDGKARIWSNAIFNRTYTSVNTTPASTDQSLMVITGSGTIGRFSSGTIFQPQVYSDVISTRAVYVSSNGHLGTTSSARRTKNLHEQVEMSDEILDAWAGLPTWRFDYKADDAHAEHVGVVAEEVHEAGYFDDLIYYDERTEEQGGVPGQIDGFAYEKMGVWNRLAIRRLLARVKELESRIPA